MLAGLQHSKGYVEGGRLWSQKSGGGRRGAGQKQTDEDRNNNQAPARAARTAARSVKEKTKSTIEKIKDGRRARAATSQKKKNNLFAGTFKQFVSL